MKKRPCTQKPRPKSLFAFTSIADTKVDGACYKPIYWFCEKISNLTLPTLKHE
jgi:hypothetical protein